MPIAHRNATTSSFYTEAIDGIWSKSIAKFRNIFHNELSDGKKYFNTICSFFNSVLCPQYELLFCIEDKDDPAVEIVNSLMEKYPTIDSHLFIGMCDSRLSLAPKYLWFFFRIGGSDVGVNPKINNMNAAYEASNYEFVMISDSGIKSKKIQTTNIFNVKLCLMWSSSTVRDDTLLDMVQHMSEKTGLVHQMPFTCDRDGFAATFEKVFH